MAEEILHSGTVIEVTPEFTSVEMVSESACASCHAKGLCGMGESKIKVIQVPTRGWALHEVGEQVQVALRRSMGFKAVWIAYVIPLFVLMAVLLSMVELGFSEPVAGLSSLVAIALYYLGIFLFRNRLRNDYSFYIK